MRIRRVTSVEIALDGDGHGAVEYGALLTTSQGGGIDVQLSADRQILSSQPLN